MARMKQEMKLIVNKMRMKITEKREKRKGMS
jgi:hypothetical protein